MSKVDLSIIILSYNTETLLKRCLETVENLTKDNLSVEVIVVDNASSDGSVKMVREKFPKFQLIESKKNLGFAGGNNLGLRHTHGNYILFLNSDTELKPSAVTEMIKFMESDKKIGAVTPKTILFNGEMDPDCHRGFPTPWASLTYFLGLESLFPRSRIFGQYHRFYQDLNEAHEIDAGFGTFMFVKKKALDDAGVWDDSYFFYGEDLDLFYRIKQKGWKVMFYPKPLLLHHKGASSGLRSESREVARVDKETRVRVAKASIRAMEIFYKKFYRDKYPLVVTLLIIVGIRIKGTLRIIYHLLH